MKLFDNPKTLWNFNEVIFVTTSLILGLTIGGIFLGSQIILDEKAYYYTLSSIFQGLFAILALAGIFIVFLCQRFDKFIDKFDRDIREDLHKLDEWGKERRSQEGIPDKELYLEPNELQEILYYLDLREMEKYFKMLEKVKTKISDNLDRYRQENDAYGRCRHRGFLIYHYKTWRDCVLTLLRRPMYQGIIVILFSIIFLPLLNSSSPFNPKIPMELIIGILVTGTIFVILDITYLIRLTLWKGPPRCNWEKADPNKPHKTIKGLNDEPFGYKQWREVIEEAKDC
jgi:hypothetical protein